ncbi:MAG: HAD-IB family phosphatase [Syntrophorhabdales bacterium]
MRVAVQNWHTWYYTAYPVQKIDFFAARCYKVSMAVKIVFFDCDGTLTTVKSSWQYLHERLGLWDGKADEFQRLFRSGVIDYGEFCRRDAALWKGMSEKRVLDIIGEIPYHEGVKETMKALRREGVFTVILSTGLSLLVEKVKGELDMTHALANDLIVKEGVLTGEIRLNVAHDRESPSHAHGSGAGSRSKGFKDKGYWVRNILRDLGLRKDEAAAVGDSEGDRTMFEEAGIAIGYHPGAKTLPFLDHALHNGSFKEVFEVLRARP